MEGFKFRVQGSGFNPKPTEGEQLFSQALIAVPQPELQKLGMFSLVLTVLNRDYSRGCQNPD